MVMVRMVVMKMTVMRRRRMVILLLTVLSHGVILDKSFILTGPLFLHL